METPASDDARTGAEAGAGAESPLGSQPGAAPGSGPVWLFLLKPKWLGWHATMVIAFCGMLWLGEWQFHRAVGGNGLSWAYTFEWPMFAVFSVVFWAKTIRDEIGIRTGKIADPRLVNDLIAAAAQARALSVIDPTRPRAITAGLPETLDPALGVRQAEIWEDDEPMDEELARYNAYLAGLSLRDMAEGQ
jgi:hypothetical protein